jgi:hypothetical protein
MRRRNINQVSNRQVIQRDNARIRMTQLLNCYIKLIRITNYSDHVIKEYEMYNALKVFQIRIYDVIINCKI